MFIYDLHKYTWSKVQRTALPFPLLNIVKMCWCGPHHPLTAQEGKTWNTPAVTPAALGERWLELGSQRRA